MKKIALVTTAKNEVSGVTVFMELLRSRLIENGYDARLVYPVETVLLETGQIGYAISYALLRDELKDFDLVMGNGVGLAGAIDLPIKVVYNAHSNSIGGNLNLRAAFGALTRAEKFWLDKILKAVGKPGWRCLDEALNVNKVYFAIDKVIARKADRVLAVAPEVSANMIKHFEVPAERVETIVNGVDPVWLADREAAAAIAAHPVNVVFSGRAGGSPNVMFHKGLDRILGAFSGLKSVHPVAILRIDAEKFHVTYQKLFSKHGISVFCNLAHDDLRSYLRANDIYAFASRTEACPLALLEAMASGMAVVAFPIAMVNELIVNGENGYVVHSIAEMRRTIEKLAKDPSLRERLGRQARATIQKDYTAEIMTERYVTAIRKML